MQKYIYKLLSTPKFRTINVSTDNQTFFQEIHIPFDDYSKSLSSQQVRNLLKLDKPFAKGTCGLIYHSIQYQGKIIKEIKFNNILIPEIPRVGIFCQNLAAKELNCAPTIHYVAQTEQHCYILMDEVKGDTLKSRLSSMTFNTKIHVLLDLSLKIYPL